MRRRKKDELISVRNYIGNFVVEQGEDGEGEAVRTLEPLGSG
jgi:hypothetical protein